MTSIKRGESFVAAGMGGEGDSVQLLLLARAAASENLIFCIHADAVVCERNALIGEDFDAKSFIWGFGRANV